VGAGPAQSDDDLVVDRDDFFDEGADVGKTGQTTFDVALRSLWSDDDAVGREHLAEDLVGLREVAVPSFGEPTTRDAFVICSTSAADSSPMR
jgi:hypothetical protein